MQQHGSKYFADPYPPIPPSPGVGSKGQNSTFSEHRHVAYRIIGNHKMQQHGSRYFADPYPPPPIPPSPGVG